MTGVDKWTNSFMQAMTCRTAGFASIDQGAMKPSIKILSCILMFIGASPASTGGGIKTTTMAVSLLMVWSVIRGREHITVFGKEISMDNAKRAIALMFIALLFALAVTTAIVVLEDGHGFDAVDLGYETISAVTTTGLSSMGTGNLRTSSQILLMPLMYLGRVGPLTLAMALAHRQSSRVMNRVRHPEENVMIG
jgi:trk system potassium uptake protein TrkH